MCNDCNERDRYVIAVKQEANGRGGSLSFTTGVNCGDLVSIEPPDNDFPMSESEPKRFIFIAGGIGITPIRARILHCVRQGKQNFTLYYFTRTPELMAFRDEFRSPEFEEKAVLHHDNGDPEQTYDLWPILEEQKGAHLYCCGPRGLMDAVRDMTGHWPDSAVHFEDFVGATATRVDDTPFEVRLEPISKLPEQDEQARELNEAEEVLRIKLPADEETPAPLNPGEEAFDQPAASISAELAAVLGERLHPVRTMQGDHRDALAAQFLVEAIAIVGAIADEVIRLGLDHVEVEAELHQANFVMVGGVRAHRQRQAVAIHNCHDFQAFSAFRRTDLGAAALGHRKRSRR